MLAGFKNEGWKTWTYNSRLQRRQQATKAGSKLRRLENLDLEQSRLQRRQQASGLEGTKALRTQVRKPGPRTAGCKGGSRL